MKTFVIFLLLLTQIAPSAFAFTLGGNYRYQLSSTDFLVAPDANVITLTCATSSNGYCTLHRIGDSGYTPTNGKKFVFIGYKIISASASTGVFMGPSTADAGDNGTAPAGYPTTDFALGACSGTAYTWVSIPGGPSVTGNGSRFITVRWGSSVISAIVAYGIEI